MSNGLKLFAKVINGSEAQIRNQKHDKYHFLYLYQFQRYYPANSMDIQQQSPIKLECSYRRTSTLRYRISDDDRVGTTFRCEASIPVSTGVSRGYSPEFQVRPGNLFYLLSCFMQKSSARSVELHLGMLW